MQLLFADASTGARSPALVRQGQIGELISAKPQARRKILEEAAGITGLHTRRHEAELRLKAAETNLTRLEDVVSQIETQLSSLKRQARQASRYKALSGHIRQAEATQLHLKWSDAAEAVAGEQTALNDIAQTMGEHTRSSSQTIRAQEEAAETLPNLRDEEITAAAILQRLNVERETLEAEEARAAERKAELTRRRDQVNQDLERERSTIAETGDILARLDAEENELGAAGTGDDQVREEAATAQQEAEAALREREAALDEASQASASLRAQRASIEGTIAEHTRRVERLAAQLETVDRDLTVLGTDSAAADAIAEKTRAVEEITSVLADAETATEAAEAAHSTARSAEQERRGELDDLERESQKLATEVKTLSNLLAVADSDLWPPLIDAVKVEPGFETALGAALGDDLDIPTDEAAPIHWHGLPPLDASDALPGDAVSLASVVKAPPALARRLAHIGVVDADRGAKLQASLKPGQRLVSKAGDLWRWDGLVAAADAPTAAAQRLAQRNRLGDLEIESTEASRKAQAARDSFNEAREATKAAGNRENELRGAWRTANRQLVEIREALSKAERAASEASARHSALNEAKSRLEGDVAETRAALEMAQAERDALPPWR